MEGKLYTIHPIKGSYATANDKFIKDNGEDYELEELIEILEKDSSSGYNIRVNNKFKEGPYIYKLFGDIDGYNGSVEDLKAKFVEFFKNKLDLKISPRDISYTNNKSKKGSYHYAIPKYYCSSKKMKEIIAAFRDTYQEDFPDKVIDTTIYSCHWWRYPNQLKSGVEGTEHKIIEGHMKDFIIDHIDDTMKNIEDCEIKSDKPKKEKPLKEKVKKEKPEKEKPQEPEIKKDDKYKFVKNIEWKILYMFFDECYKQKRFDNNEYWIYVGMGIKDRYGDSGLELFEYFSNKASEEKRDTPEKIKAKYGSFRSKGITLSTLYYYAKEDNKEKYIELIKTESPMKKLDLTEYGVAGYLKYLEPNNFIWKDNNLYCYNGKYWDKDDIIMRKFISTTLFEFLQDIVATCFWDHPKFNNIKSSLDKLKKVEFKKNVVKSSQEIFDKSEIEFDSKYNLLGFTNIVYDLNTGEFREYQYDDYITMTTGYAWREPTKEEKSIVTKLLDKIFPIKDEKEFYLEILSTSFEGRCLENFIIANGKGRNGKGLVHDLLLKLLGHYGFIANSSLLFEKQRTGSNPEKANINKKRLVIFREPPKERKIENSIMKELTGSGDFAARGHHDSDTQKKLHCTVFLECNSKPDFAETPEDADVKRVIDCLFRCSFTATNKEEIDEESYTYMPDVKYKTDEFKQQYKYALGRILMEYYKCYKERNYKFNIPEQIKARSLSYLEMSCNILGWVKDVYDKTDDKNDIVTLKQMYDEFKHSDYFSNLSKADKRLYNYAYFIKQMSENIFFRKSYKEILNVGPKRYQNLLVGYKLKEIVPEENYLF